mgnify:CR=1 FL=1
MTDNPILQPLIENAEEAKVKPVVQNDGKTVLFQREPRLPPTEDLNYEVDELDNVPEKTYINEEFFEEPKHSSTISLDKEGNPNYLTETEISEDTSSNIEEIDGYEDIPLQLPQRDKNPKPISAKSSPTQIPHNNSQQKKSLSPSATFSRQSKSRSPPGISHGKISYLKQSEKPSFSSDRSSVSPKVRYNPTLQSGTNSNLIFVIFYFISVIAILISFLISHNEEVDESLRYNKYEQIAVFYLNDCIRKTKNLSIEYFKDQEFIDYVKQDKSQYLAFDESENVLVIKKPHQTLFCKAIDFGERHPDYAGLFIIWFIAFVLYIHYEISRLRATKMLPDVMKILQQDKMCYIDEAKRQMEDRGYFLLGAWWQVKSLINSQKNVKTVKMLDAKPFWSMESPR